MNCSEAERHDFLYTCGASVVALRTLWSVFAVISGVIAVYALHGASVTMDWRKRLQLLGNVATALGGLIYGFIRVAGDGQLFGVTPAVSWVYGATSMLWSMNANYFVYSFFQSAMLPVLRLGGSVGGQRPTRRTRATARKVHPGSPPSPSPSHNNSASSRSLNTVVGTAMGKTIGAMADTLSSFHWSLLLFAVLSSGIWYIVPGMMAYDADDFDARDALLIVFWVANVLNLFLLVLFTHVAASRIIGHIDFCLRMPTNSRADGPLKAARARLLFAKSLLVKSGVSTAAMCITLSCWPWLRREASSYIFPFHVTNGMLAIVAGVRLTRQHSKPRPSAAPVSPYRAPLSTQPLSKIESV